MNIADTDELIEVFPTLEIEILDLPAGDQINIKHVSGDPIYWREYKMIIMNQTDPSNSMVLITLPGQTVASEISHFNITNTPNFDKIDFNNTDFYDLELYNIKDSKRVFQKTNILCTTKI
jgi:hypothetical protein